MLTAKLIDNDLRENEHRDAGAQICTELNLELLFRLTTTDSQSPVTSSPVTKITPQLFYPPEL